MRGKVDNYEDYADTEGITPAYAGKRISPPVSASGVLDHPRLCGEKKESFASF